MFNLFPNNFLWGYGLLPVLLWSLFWKAWSLWVAARKNEKIWFGALLVLNTLGILEILYIFYFSKRQTEAKKSFTTEEAKAVAAKLGIDWSKYDLEQGRMGMDVELEHGKHDPHVNVTNDDAEITGKIALAHLNEFADYYTRLDKMEKEADAFWGKKN